VAAALEISDRALRMQLSRLIFQSVGE